MTTTSALLLLLVTMDPLGNIANFIAGLRPVPPEQRVRVIARELVFALAILLFFLFCGRWIMGLLHLKDEALFISGGIVLFLIALKKASAYYPDPTKGVTGSPDCAWMKAEGENCVVEIGPIFKRDEAKRRHELAITRAP